jgi:aminoglycoside 3-N-acetyltransferase I
MADIQIARLGAADLDRARHLFLTLAEIFETESTPLSDTYLSNLLARDDFWALAATVDGQLVGGLTAHTLLLTRAEMAELFIYDIAVLPAFQRRGIGRQLIAALRAQAASQGITVVFVPADNEDTHALDFYQALGGEPQPVTIFTF